MTFRHPTGKALRTIACLLALGALLTGEGMLAGEKRERTPYAATPHFVFFSDFATTLNDALIAAGVARRFRKPALFESGAEKACLEALPPSARAGWGRSLDYYAEIVSPHEWDEREQYLLRVDLAGFDDELTGAADRQFVTIARGFRAAAAPAYEACRWTAQDAANRAWIDAVKPRLLAHEEAIARRLEGLYQKPWGGLPIPVDVVETVNWAGANSILLRPAGGHLLVSSTIEGPAALEVVFHEASHLLMGRDAPIREALDDAARAAGQTLPGDLWHVVLFYTTGEAVRRILLDAGEPPYTPMLDEIQTRNERWAGYRKALDEAWRPYLDGKRTLAEAATDLVRALPEQGTSTR